MIVGGQHVAFHHADEFLENEVVDVALGSEADGHTINPVLGLSSLIMGRDAVRTGMGAARLPVSPISHDLADGTLVHWGDVEGPLIAHPQLRPSDICELAVRQPRRKPVRYSARKVEASQWNIVSLTTPSKPSRKSGQEAWRLSKSQTSWKPISLLKSMKSSSGTVTPTLAPSTFSVP